VITREMVDAAIDRVNALANLTNEGAFGDGDAIGAAMEEMGIASNATHGVVLAAFTPEDLMAVLGDDAEVTAQLNHVLLAFTVGVFVGREESAEREAAA
jgi:hypothetical protein